MTVLTSSALSTIPSELCRYYSYNDSSFLMIGSEWFLASSSLSSMIICGSAIISGFFSLLLFSWENYRLIWRVLTDEGNSWFEGCYSALLSPGAIFLYQWDKAYITLQGASLMNHPKADCCWNTTLQEGQLRKGSLGWSRLLSGRNCPSLGRTRSYLC